MNADGGGLVQLTSDHPPAVNDESPSWSPDGTKIAFASNRDESYDIYVMDTDGENPVQLTPEVELRRLPPVGHRMA